MSNVSPYRTLPSAERLRLVAHDIGTSRESRDGFIRAMVARGGGFRPEKLRKWPPDQLARDVVRFNLESPQDELRLLVTLYVELEPALQVEFLDAVGVQHEGASIPDDLPTPFADAARVRAAAAGLLQAHGEAAQRYLRTIALYNNDAWPGLADMLLEVTPGG